MRPIAIPVLLSLATMASPVARGADAPAPAQPLPNSPLVWDLREVQHPRMGLLTLAVPAASIVTPVGKEKIDSLVYFSCERARGKIAIELANAAESDPKGGLMPGAMPRMVCNLRSGPIATREIPANWYVSELGDALVRGLTTAELRRCASIEITQTLALPRGWGRESQRIDIELIPYKKELEAVMLRCDGPIVAPVAKAEAPPPGPPAPAAQATAVGAPALPSVPAAAPRSAPAEAPWKPAHVITGGRTNVRGSPAIGAPVVTQLAPNEPVLVQFTGTEWWKARPRAGARFHGYIRQDRLVFE